MAHVIRAVAVAPLHVVMFSPASSTPPSILFVPFPFVDHAFSGAEVAGIDPLVDVGEPTKPVCFGCHA